MAVTKVMARKAHPKVGIEYILNGDKTEDKAFTWTQRCTPEYAASRMLKTKAQYNKTGGVQYYHMIQSFEPGEATPELAPEIAQAFAQRHLPGYEVVIGTHVDRHHIHSHIMWNSVCAETGEKYHSSAKTYYGQIRVISDELCREYGLSVIEEENPARSLSYAEWLRQSRGQPTFRAMLDADLREAIEDANDLGHFFLLMEHRGWEIRHGSRLGYRLRGQERYMVPERKNPTFSEEGIRAAIEGNLAAIEAGRRPIIVERYHPYPKGRKYSGFLALYAHYLYVLGKIEKREYPPRMTAKLKADVMRFEQLRGQFAFLRENDIATQEDMTVFVSRTVETLAGLLKQRTLLNVRKKKRQALYAALADAEALAPAEKYREKGLAGLEDEYTRYEAAVRTLNNCGVSREQLTAEKAALYENLAEVNRAIRAERKKLKLCAEITGEAPRLEREIDQLEGKRAAKSEKAKSPERIA